MRITTWCGMKPIAAASRRPSRSTFYLMSCASGDQAHADLLSDGNRYASTLKGGLAYERKGAHAQNAGEDLITDEGFDLMDREAKRHGWSPSDAVNYMLSELDDWRSGRRRFVNVARQSRDAHAGQSSSHLPANRLK